MPGCHFPFCLNNPELCTFWSGPCLSQVTFADGDPHAWGTQLSSSFPYGQAGICVNQEASLQQVEIWPHWIYWEGTGPSPSLSASLVEAVEEHCAVPGIFTCSSMLFVKSGKSGKPSKGLCALTLKCFHWHALAQGCLGKLTPDLCGKQPELSSSWTTLQGLRDVEDAAPSWTRLTWKEPTPFLHHYHGCFCGFVSVALLMWKGLWSLLRRKENNIFQKMWPLGRLSLQNRVSNCGVFFVILPFSDYIIIYILS